MSPWLGLFILNQKLKKENAKMIQEKTTDEQREYYEKYIHNVCVSLREYLNDENGWEGRFVSSDRYDTYMKNRQDKVFVPECPKGAYILENLMKHKEEQYDRDWDNYIYHDGKELDYINEKHLFINEIWNDRDYFDEVLSVVSNELFEDVRTIYIAMQKYVDYDNQKMEERGEKSKHNNDDDDDDEDYIEQYDNDEYDDDDEDEYEE